MLEINIIGYSGHSFVCLDTAIKSGLTINGYFEKEKKTYNPFNLKFLGNEKESSSTLPTFICIGDSLIRSKLYQKLKNRFNFDVNIIDNSSYISDYSSLGRNIYVGRNCIINFGSKIGNFTVINSGALIEHNNNIGEYCFISPKAVLLGDVSVGNKTFIGSNATILPGVKIGNNSIVGAGSVVLKDIPDNSVYVGSPAKFIKSNTHE